MTIKEPTILLEHILESIDLIEKRIKNITHDKFINDVDLQDMVIRRLEIVGEAVRNLPRDFRETHSSINWQHPANMRSVLIHGYLNVDLDIVWNTILHDLPPFKKQVQRLLKELKS